LRCGKTDIRANIQHGPLSEPGEEGSPMRQDMAHVIVERPRIGSSLPSRKKGYRKYVQTTGLDNLPRREPLLGHWRGRERFLNEHLSPMFRFLRSNIGRPWNKVHQELCEHVSFDNAVQKHVLAHVFDYVDRHVELVGDQVFSRDRPWRGRRPLSAGQMYVCPATGLLKEVRRSRRRRPPTRIPIEVQRLAILRDGAWWEVGVRKIPDDPGELWDLWLERPVAQLTTEKCTATYGGKLFATSMRALSREETRQLLRHHARSRG